MTHYDDVVYGMVLANLIEETRASRSRIDLALDTPQGRWSGSRKRPAPPPPCPPAPIRLAVLPTLDERQARVLWRATRSAVYDGWSLWRGRWRNRAELAEIWSREPVLCWPNPFLPAEFAWTIPDGEPLFCPDDYYVGEAPYAQPMPYLGRGDRVGWTDQHGVIHTGVITDRRETARGTELDIVPDEEGSTPCTSPTTGNRGQGTNPNSLSSDQSSM